MGMWEMERVHDAFYVMLGYINLLPVFISGTLENVRLLDNYTTWP